MHLTPNITALLYLVASICFIMALRGLSSPETSRGGNIYGIVGMVIAVATTVAQDDVLSYGWIAAAILIGGAIGTFIALKIEMTAVNWSRHCPNAAGVLVPCGIGSFAHLIPRKT